MNEQLDKQRQQQPARGQQKPERIAQESKNSVAPVVDIFEGAEETWVVADLPGVVKEALHVEVENDELRFRAEAKPFVDGAPVIEFSRAFRLPPGIDAARVSADLKDGVLTLKLPKPAELKPRKIDVRVA